jgi:uncharacterized protein YbgA (DUF1722 family)/uncharacterized protein YbbK (DUF523 family)
MSGKKQTPASFGTAPRIPIGISSCLLGEAVRYDGGHKLDLFITGTLAHYFDFVPVCPEVAIGMGVPREPIHLVTQRSTIHAVGVRNSALDVTDSLNHYAESMGRKLAHLCGYIFKSGSPSCGLDEVKLFTPTGISRKTARGIYAKEFMAQQPLIPCEDEVRLADPWLLDNFLQRVAVLYRWRQMLASRLTVGKLVDFHSRHKYIILAHQPRAYLRLVQLIASAGKGTVREVAETYIYDLMQALTRIATRAQHTKVLQQLLGYLKKHLENAEKQEILAVIADYQRGDVPLLVPVTLLNHYFHRYPDPYITKQYYLMPHPYD